MAKSNRNYSQINEWQRANNDRIQVLVNKGKRLPERIQMAVDAGKAGSRQKYIIEAIEARLIADGIPMPDTQGDAGEQLHNSDEGGVDE